MRIDFREIIRYDHAEESLKRIDIDIATSSIAGGVNALARCFPKLMVVVGLPLFSGSSGFESLILSHHFRFPRYMSV